MSSDERKQQMIELPIKLLVIALCAWLYSFGGLEGTSKLWRRMLAPALCVSTLYYFLRDWKVFIQLPFMFAGASVGYGADALWAKIGRRFVAGMAYAVSVNGFYMYKAIKDGISRYWKIVAWHACAIVSASIVFGVWNPFQSARIEETVLGFVIYGLPILTAKKE